ncbi:bifunctional anthranilate synthase component I family protein/class IV aminotransferase [Polynucleobacter sp. HIN9]|uniref:bifunctional chorismate-binding protein/class IV aminotransferase n=1 Tax=Polynucleobacter sp. HIN9 TaxID=3047868 RepID=UPI002572F01D|nr:bifunctional anthranilate synthase component I family protein/class IV aminotransferase [Polynucleobacter sp. HIN9]BEI41061.1 bifunctional anthranilate synthase component I family protein/class IV aminotransferase [Polynucleobacter sp. HIN9]
MLLLDDVESSREQPTSRLYQHVQHEWCVNRFNELDTCFDSIETALGQGQYVVALFAYELGYYWQGIACKHPEPLPLLRAWSFAEVSKLSKEAVDAFLHDRLVIESTPSGILNRHDSINHARFTEDIERIQAWIAAGDTYQINHSYRVYGQAYGSPLALYARLRERQPGRYGAFIEDGHQVVLSQSPELFIRRSGDTLIAEPMKGTADATLAQASELANDPKNQAENVMIVDLLRNDLGRIAQTGSVHVPALFEVKQHGQVLQMTSTVQAKPRANLRIEDVLRAVFPCGSVTGAPKKRSMEIIQALEDQPRGWYCGALGWFDPNGDFAMSVPIRTLQMDHDSESDSSSFVLGVGAGITIDSDADTEYQECQLKASFLTSLPSGVGIFETIRFDRGCDLNRIANWSKHLERLSSSARNLGIQFDDEVLQNMVQAAAADLAHDSIHRVRIDLSSTGQLSLSHSIIEKLPGPVQLFWAHEILQGDYTPQQLTMQSHNPLLRHKVSERVIYDAAWHKAVELGGFDALFINEHGHVTEGGRTSVLIREDVNGPWLTPPLSAGVLPGVMRSVILADPSMNAREANLTITQVANANEIMLCNALRGMIPAHL